MRSIIVCFLIIVLALAKGISQNKKNNLINFADLEDSIATISNLLATDSVFNLNDLRNTQLENLLEKFLKQPESFNYALTKITALSVLIPEDKTFRIITWTFLRDSLHNEHRGYVQLNTAKSFYKKLIPATSYHAETLREVLTPENWMGALYYNLKSFKFNGEMRYLLFGVNFGDGVEKSKVCEVLKIKNKSISFGSPVFVQKSESNKIKNNRIVLNYSSDAEVRLNYDDAENLIIYDHLTQGASSTNQPILIPDGTYEAYKLTKEGWEYIEQLPTTIMSEAPRPKPLDKSSRQIYTSQSKKKPAPKN